MRRISKKSKRAKKQHGKMRHAKKRAWERFAIDLTPHDISIIIKAISSSDPSKAKMLKKLSYRTRLYVIRWKGKIIPVVYDILRKYIVTTLPYQALKKYGIS